MSTNNDEYKTKLPSPHALIFTAATALSLAVASFFVPNKTGREDIRVEGLDPDLVTPSILRKFEEVRGPMVAQLIENFAREEQAKHFPKEYQP